MKKGKKILIAIFSILSALCFLTAIGCNNAFDSKEKDVATESLGLTFEYMTDAQIPIEKFEGVTETELLDGKVMFRFTSPEYTEKKEVKYDVYKSFSPRVFCDKVGTWTVACVFNGKTSVKSFEVKDQTKPELSLPELAYDVWASETATYSLPQREVFDLSEIDRKSVSEKITLTYTYYEIDGEGNVKLDGENNPVIFTKTNDVKILTGRTYTALPAVKYLTEEEAVKYVPTETPGVLDYSLSAKDEYGNEQTLTAKWNVKDSSWTPKSLEDGYYADYDSVGYINSVSSGKASSYWYKSAINETYLDEYTDEDGKKANGVIKVSAPPNKDYSMGCFKFKLYKDVLKSDLENEDKFFVIKMLTPNANVVVRFGCMVWRNANECVHTAEINIQPNKWTYVVVPYSELRDGNFKVGDKNGGESVTYVNASFNEFQITFGSNVPKNVLLEDCVMYIDSVTLADRLPTVDGKSFDLNNNVLTWDAVENADYYEVIEDGITEYVTTNSYTVKNVGAPITVRAMSDNALKVSSDAKIPFVDVSGFGENDIAKFDNRYYEALAMINDVRPGRRANSVVAEYVTEYTDKEGKREQDILKVTSTAASSHAQPADILLRLPKTITNGVTIRFLIKSSDAKAIYFRKTGHESHNLGIVTLNQTISENKKDVWQTMYLDFNNVNEKYHDVIELLIQSGESGAKHEVYFSFVLEGDHRMTFYQEENEPIQDQLDDLLQEDYLADFADEKYVKLVEKSARTSRTASDIEVEKLGSYQNEQNVLKTTVTLNDNGIGDVLMWLPKGTETNKLTIRFMFSDSSVKTLYWLNPSNQNEPKSVDDGAITFLNTGAGNKANKWQTACVDYKNSSIKDRLELLVAGGNAGDKIEIYFSFVLDGDHRKDLYEQENAPIKTELAKNLQTNYLADFANDSYVDLVEVSTRASRTALELNAERLESFMGENDVLKVTTTNNLNGIADFVINLPKACVNGMTVKFMVENISAKTMYWFNPSNFTEDKSIDDNALVFVGTGAGTQEGVWQTIYINYSASQEVKDVLDVMLAGGESKGTNTVYFAFVMDGDQRETVKQAELTKRKTNLEEVKSELSLGLATNQLASFDSEKYVDFVTMMHGYNDRLKVEYLPDYQGETGVIKLTVEHNKFHSVNSSDAAIMIDLVKALSEGSTAKFSVKYRFEKLSSGALPAAVEFRQTDVYGTMLTPKVTNSGGELTVNEGAWRTANVTTAGQDKNSLVLYTYFSGSSNGYVLYISEITDGTNLS